ncbi:hypothetical protein NEOLEDRAFT_1242156 [Neolentinus lepideus HHB14362 ss-1]|uniref:Uncharacterized protein n=1 Tax=Neolentinus lepideus HHB14362 ss-1 TaxID=1314782 RepID=A0A165SG74_9AGAM|nr:hypothetical protein NEOLEDRAFT_1242156 [Neolentinus lepideus HHB14362 ss-1]
MSEQGEPKARRGRRDSRGSQSSVSHFNPTSLTGFAAKIDLEKRSAEEARRLMCKEHKIFGYRSPGSPAVEAQSTAEKHPEGVSSKKELNCREFRKVALEDTVPIQAEHVSQLPGL